jgi:uncharacterized protein (DUF302 family)
VEVLVAGNPVRAAEAMREHIEAALQNTLQRLEPYFQLREANGKTYIRSLNSRSLKKQARPAD